MTHLFLPRVLEHLEALVALDTRNPPRTLGANGPLVQYLTHTLSPALNVAVTHHGEGCLSVLAVRGEPRLLFNVHLDTVPADPGWKTDPLRLHVTSERAVGLGAADTKGAAAALLAALEVTLGPAAVLFTTDEEAGNSTCIQQFLATQPKFDAVVVAEPTQAQAVLAHRGIFNFTAQCTGVGGHASLARAREDSAVHGLMRWGALALDAMARFDGEVYDTLTGVRLNIGTVEGGTKPNMIAAQAQARCSLRLHAGTLVQHVMDALVEVAPNPARFVLTPGFTAPTLPAPGQPAAHAVVAALGLPVGPAVDFWTEAALFSAAGIPALVLGAGDIAQAHTAGEFVALSQLEALAKLHARMLGGVC